MAGADDHSFEALLCRRAPRPDVRTGTPMLIRLFTLILADAAVVANAEEPAKVDIEAAEKVAALIGAPVFA